MTGENGVGKTNILEAISYLSPGRGLRRAVAEQVGKLHSNGAWTVFASLDSPSDMVNIGTGLQFTANGLEPGRKLHINGSLAKSSDMLLDYCRVLWLTPAMDGLFTGPSSDRRRFLDRLVLAVDPMHGRRVNDFEKAMRARNKLLDEPNPDGTWLDAIEAQMAELGAAIACARHELVHLLSDLINRNRLEASPFPDASLALNGVLEDKGELAASDLELEYARHLRDNRARDARAGRTLEGPHRSDLRVLHAPKNMPAELSSTGEQKALLIGITLAHAQLVAETTRFTPILLLDEIAAHLDGLRRAALFDMLESLGCQAWMTGTDANLFSALKGRAKFCTICDGDIQDEGDG